MTGYAPQETDFQGAVVEAAELYGWRHMHVRKAKVRDDQYATPTSVEGWPDLVLWRPRKGGLIFAELKTNEGKVSRAQREVLASLSSAGAVTAVWRPSDWHLIVEMLSGKPAGGGEAGVRTSSPADQEGGLS